MENGAPLALMVNASAGDSTKVKAIGLPHSRAFESFIWAPSTNGHDVRGDAWPDVAGPVR